MENVFGAKNYEDVASDNATRVAQTATNEYAVFLFKKQHINNTDTFTVAWNGQTDYAPSSSTVYLQVYNRVGATWDEIDSDSTTGVNTDFDLTGSITSNLGNYYDGSFWIACRVYQRAI